MGVKVLEELGDLNWQRVKLPAGLLVDDAIARYNKMDGVEYAQPNFYYHLLNTPNDPQFINLYGLTKISAPAAWDLSIGSPNVVVADIDTGLRYTHDDIAANAWVNSGEIPGNGIDDDGDGFVDDVYGYDFRYNSPDPMDQNGHGTHTAGTIGAVGNNLIGVVGVNWSVKIMAIKIYSPTGTDTTSAMLINAYNYVRMMKNRGVNIRVTNNSYGGCTEACGFDQATKDAIDALGNAGILNVFAAGNSNSNNDTAPFYPASYTSPSILAVAASDSNDSKAGFSSYGANSVDLAAPGVGILSTYYSSNSSYTTLSGTSMATPHVAGAAALLAAYRPALSAASLKATLMNTVDPIPVWNGLVKSGGRLNIFNALQNPTVCSFNTGTGSIDVGTDGGVFNINVTAATNCDYGVKSNDTWIQVLSSATLSGNGTVTISVAQNPTARTGTISIAGQAFTVNQQMTQRVVSVVNSYVTPGQMATLPIDINSLGNEASVAFSLSYDPTLITTPTVACGSSAPGCNITMTNPSAGVLGVTVVPVAPFNAGLREIADVTFNTVATNASNSPINFSDAPTLRLVTNASNDALATNYTNGFVVFAQGMEGDIAPEKTGDGQLRANDVTIERLFVVGNLVPDLTFNEFQRADVAPRNTGGDGQLDAADIVQTRRYVSGLDIMQPANGPGGPLPPVLTATAGIEGRVEKTSDLSMRIVSAVASLGETVSIPIELDNYGDTVAVSFTLDFDVSKLRNPRIALGPGASAGAVLTTNRSKVGKGRVAVLVDSNEPFRGSRIVVVTFDVAANAAGDDTSVTFSDAIARRSVSDQMGNLFPVEYVNGTVSIASAIRRHKSR
jgi:subtilisin family serine protease